MEIEDGRAFVLETMTYSAGSVLRGDVTLPKAQVLDPNTPFIFLPGEDLIFDTSVPTLVTLSGYFLDYDDPQK